MNQDYASAFRAFRDEFRSYKHGSQIIKPGSKALVIQDDPKSADALSIAASDSLSSSCCFSPPISKSSSDTVPMVSNKANIVASMLIQQAPVTSMASRKPEEVQAVENNGCPVVQRSQRPRKGHKKSRQGCYNCKGRKIKCQETHPECENCTRRNIRCNYPAPKTFSDLQLSASYAPQPIASVKLSSTPTNFNLTDMRLFHHFLMTAYPHLPVGNDSAWLYQVPLIAHHNEYLMHAILGLAASHLELTTGADLRSSAIQHRILAIRGSNAVISKPNRSGSDADALLASCYALTFQSSYMEDGMSEFFQMVRGCSLLREHLRTEDTPMAFFIAEKDHFQYMEDKLLELPVIDRELVDSAERSLMSLPLLFDRTYHSHFYELLTSIISTLKLSSLGAYFKFVMVYQGIVKMDAIVFQEFIDPNNSVALLLISHFLAIQIILAPILDREYSGRARMTRHIDWLSTLHRNCRPRLKKYMEWPMVVRDHLRDEVKEKGCLNPTLWKSRKEGLSKAMS